MSKFENIIDMKKLNDLLSKKDVELAKLYKLLGKKEAVQEEAGDAEVIPKGIVQPVREEQGSK